MPDKGNTTNKGVTKWGPNEIQEKAKEFEKAVEMLSAQASTLQQKHVLPLNESRKQGSPGHSAHTKVAVWLRHGNGCTFSKLRGLPATRLATLTAKAGHVPTGKGM